MGINEFFYGGCMRLGNCSGVKRIILFIGIFLSAFSLANPVSENPAELAVRNKLNSSTSKLTPVGLATENKAERIVRDLLSSAYNRTHNLPAVIPNGQLSSMQQMHKANVLRSIAKKAVRVSGVLYSKHPITGLAITLGAGFLADELIDKAFQKFTSASKDPSGAFYVVVSDPKTGKQTKVYLEEEPSLLNPAYVSLGESKLVTYDDAFGECRSSSYDETLHCRAEIVLQKELERLGRSSNQTVSEGQVIGYESHPIYSDGKIVRYGYKLCFTNSKECRNETGFFTVRAVKHETSVKGEPYVATLENVVDKNQVILSDDTQIANFARKAVSLDSQEFTSEERQIITNINPKDVRQHYSDPSLTANDLVKFRYSEKMFNNNGSGGAGGNNGGIGNPPSENTPSDQNPNNRPISLVDFSAPDIGLPDLDAPTSKEILSPFKKFLPELKNFELQSHPAQCPIWVVDIDFLNFHYELNEHCTLIEKYRKIFELCFGIIWSFIALRHVLSA